MSEITKTCVSCKQSLLLTSFYKNKNYKSGCQSYCKKCSHLRVKAYRRSENGRQYQKDYSRSKKQKAYQQSEAYKKSHRLAVKRWKNKNKQKDKTIAQVNYAIRSGKITKPSTYLCKCGKPAEHYHHYLGYERKHWRDIIPICHLCHNVIHGQTRDGQTRDQKIYERIFHDNSPKMSIYGILQK